MSDDVALHFPAANTVSAQWCRTLHTHCAAPERDSTQQVESQPQSHHGPRHQPRRNTGPAGPIALPSRIRTPRCAAGCARSDPGKTCGFAAQWVFLRHTHRSGSLRANSSILEADGLAAVVRAAVRLTVAQPATGRGRRRSPWTQTARPQGAWRAARDAGLQRHRQLSPSSLSSRSARKTRYRSRPRGREPRWVSAAWTTSCGWWSRSARVDQKNQGLSLSDDDGRAAAYRPDRTVPGPGTGLAAFAAWGRRAWGLARARAWGLAPEGLDCHGPLRTGIIAWSGTWYTADREAPKCPGFIAIFPNRT